MTLIIAQRKNGKVSISADSRMTFGNAGTFDRAVKIFKVPVRIKGLVKSIEDRNKWEYEHTYCLAVAGSTINAFSLKDSLVEIISNIQYMTNMSDISIIGIGAFAFKKFKEISGMLAPILQRDGLSEILFAGYCVVAKRVRVLRFYPHVNVGNIEYIAEEILIDDGLYFTGSGKAVAFKIHQANPTFSPLRIIKTVIEQKLEPTVGGLLQTGGFPKEDFHLTGVEEEIEDENGNKRMFSHFLGFDLSQPNATKSYPLLFISHGKVKVDWEWPGLTPHTQTQSNGSPNDSNVKSD